MDVHFTFLPAAKRSAAAARPAAKRRLLLVEVRQQGRGLAVKQDSQPWCTHSSTPSAICLAAPRGAPGRFAAEPPAADTQLRMPRDPTHSQAEALAVQRTRPGSRHAEATTRTGDTALLAAKHGLPFVLSYSMWTRKHADFPVARSLTALGA